MVQVIPTGIKSPKEVDGAKEALALEAAAVAVTIAETAQSLNMHLKESEKWLHLKINDYRNRALSHSIQADC